MDDNSEASREELAETMAELRDVLESLGEELQPPQRRGPGGLPRPPTPREFLAFADEAAIPAAVAFLEANVRALEALQQAIRLLRREERLREDVGEGSERARQRANELGRTTLARLDDALTDLQTAIEEGGVPEDENARTLLEEARNLRDSVDERLGEATADRERMDAESAREREGTRRGHDEGRDRDRRTTGRGEGTEIPVEGDGGPAATEADETGDDAGVDVDSELESLKREYGQADDGAGETADSDGETTADPAADGSTEPTDEGSDDDTAATDCGS